MSWDVFISHAGEDKEAVALPLAALLAEAGLAVWLDKNELRLGDSLRRKIDDGLAKSRYGVVILSKAFFSKDWPQFELNGLVARESADQKVVLPIWHEVDHKFVARYSPMLADKVAISTKRGLREVASQIVRAVRGEAPAPRPAADARQEIIRGDLLHNLFVSSGLTKWDLKELRLGLAWGILTEESGQVRFSEPFIRSLCKYSREWVTKEPQSAFTNKEWHEFLILAVAWGTSEGAYPVHEEDLVYFVSGLPKHLLSYFYEVGRGAQLIVQDKGSLLSVSREFHDEITNIVERRVNKITSARRVKPFFIQSFSEVAKAFFLLHDNENRDLCHFVAIMTARTFYKQMITDIENVIKEEKKSARQKSAAGQAQPAARPSPSPEDGADSTPR